MGDCRSDDPAGATRWTQTLGQRARSLERDFLRALDRMPWKALPKDLPPKSTVHDYLEFWNWDGTVERIHHALYLAVREQEGREASPTAAIIKLADRKGCSKRGALLDPSGYDAGKKVKGRKRHILVDTLGLLLSVVVHPADVQDRDGAFHLLRRARRMFPFIERIFADGGYAGQKMALVVWRTGAWKLQIVKRSDAPGSVVLPKRWIVERTFAWISRNGRLARDFERYATTVTAFVRVAMIRIMLKRLAANTSSSIKLLGWALRLSPAAKFAGKRGP